MDMVGCFIGANLGKKIGMMQGKVLPVH